MYRHIATLSVLLGAVWLPGAASAQETVECISHDYQYNECYAPLDAPTLVYQSSHSACIINRTWGFNAKTRRLWVSEGCSGVFADADGYHHGQSGTFDAGARQYDHRGHDTGAVVAGALLGAVIEGALDGDKKKHTTTNSYYHTGKTGSGYTGCHGVGCLVDNPDAPASYDVPEPGQTEFRSQRSDVPEPGQGEFSDNN
ncbi:DUF3011 domain-containing protein [Pseudoxanthomonas putridarboris]|uniref:DUF3011 domain-containing protein n=1 Tax=Pseudoxanthomonas putridarboris TaxID=752605 RepID=A0ABU9J3Q2_9GAMM